MYHEGGTNYGGPLNSFEFPDGCKSFVDFQEKQYLIAIVQRKQVQCILSASSCGFIEGPFVGHDSLLESS